MLDLRVPFSDSSPHPDHFKTEGTTKTNNQKNKKGQFQSLRSRKAVYPWTSPSTPVVRKWMPHWESVLCQSLDPSRLPSIMPFGQLGISHDGSSLQHGNWQTVWTKVVGRWVLCAVPILNCKSLIFSVFTALCNYQNIQFQNIFITPQKNHTP